MSLAYTQAVQMQEARISPLGETLQRARQARGITVEDAERATRIPPRYPEGREDTGPPGRPAPAAGPGVAQALPDLAGRSLDDAIAVVEEAGAGYVVIGVSEGEVPEGQVVDQVPAPGTEIGPGDLVTLIVSR